MAYKQRLGNANFFTNRNKKNPKEPDYKARMDIQVHGEIVTLDIAGWKRHGQTAGDYISLSIKTVGTKPNRDLEEAGFPGGDMEVEF